MIRVPSVRVVDEDGSQLGVMPTHQALQVAQERGFDLVEVAPNAAPPVVRFLDYGQFKYEQARKEKEARRHQRSVEFKEIRLKPKIGKGDFDTKVRRAIQFLEDGDRVKVTVQFRGREVSHAYIGRDLLLRFGDLIKEHGTVDRQPLLEGKSMSMTVASTHKPKVQAALGRDEGHGEPTTAPTEAPPPEKAAPPAATPAPAAEPVATSSPTSGG
jgi:translation initiation factor IF-3